MAVGVAIATALVPPLTTCGILIARGVPALAAGAFLLFVAITFPAMVVFMILGHHATIVGSSVAGRSRALLSRFICLGILLVLGFHLFNVFHKTFGEATLRSKSRQLVEHELLRFPGSSVVEVTLQDRFGPTSVFVAVKSAHTFTSEEVGHLNDLLNIAFGEPVNLHMRSEITLETTRDGAREHPQ
jgi:uncharacterized membrane protein